ncbi:MAG: DUF6399 domain-containing protein [Bacteroidetes bacterium]|nr:DUF6399 domain-containing protein [Bacteroidota bacterium]
MKDAAQELGVSSSTVSRNRGGSSLINEEDSANLWSTETGYQWLTTFVVITVFYFGIQKGIGMESLSYFFKLLKIDNHFGISPSSLRRLADHLEMQTISYEPLCQSQIKEQCIQKEIVVAADETFFKHMILVAMDLASGFILLETFSKDRTYPTWKAATSHFDQWNVKVRLMVSDRAKALLKLAKVGWECSHVPDLFHASREISKLMGLPFSRKISQAQKDLVKSQKKLQKDKKHFSHLAHAIGGSYIEESQSEVRHCQEELKKQIQGKDDYRQMLQAISKIIHPFSDIDSSKQTSEQVEARLKMMTLQLEELRKQFEINDSKNHLGSFKNQIKGLALSVDAWWNLVEQSLLNEHLEPAMLKWVMEVLLPAAFWNEQLSRCDHPLIKESYSQLMIQAQETLLNHSLTKKLQQHELEYWSLWAVESVNQFQRASSAVEGRNGYLAQVYHNRRGLSQNRLHALTIIHNFLLKRSDGTTAAQRLYSLDFPDFWEFLMTDLPPLPLPRKRKNMRIPNHMKLLNIST